jgi:uncharacterized protein YjbI with pentapeptide repeats
MVTLSGPPGGAAVKLGIWNLKDYNGNPVLAAYTNQTYQGNLWGAVVVNGWWTNYTSNFEVWWVGAGTIALQETTFSHYASARPDAGDSYDTNPLWFEDISGNYITAVSTDETFLLVDTSGGTIGLQLFQSWVQSTGDSINPQGTQIAANLPIQQSVIPASAQFTVTSGSLLILLLVSGSATNCNLQNADMSFGGLITSVAGCNLTGSKLQGADFTMLTDLSLAGTNLIGATIDSTTKLGAVQNINQALWTSANLTGADFSGIDPAPAGTQNVNFGPNASRGELGGATLNGTILAPSTGGFDFTGANFDTCAMTGAVLTNAILKNASFTGGVYAPDCDFSNADLTGADLTGANLTGSNLTNANLTGAKMHGTNFSNVNLTGAQFDAEPDFTRSSDDPAGLTIFAGATLSASVLGSDWSFLDLSGATITDIPDKIHKLNAQSAVLPSLIDLSDMDLKHANFSSATVINAQFNGSDLEGAIFTSAQANGCNFIGANLSLSNFTNAFLVAPDSDPTDPAVADPANFTNAFLINAVFDGATCDGVDFSNAYFCSANYKGSSGPATANGDASFNLAQFPGAILIGTQFQSAKMTGASFYQANLACAELPNANLDTFDPSSNNAVATNMKGTDLTGTQFGDSEGGKNASDLASMDGVNMTGAVVATESGTYTYSFADFHKKNVTISLPYQPTLLGTTTANTKCPPDGADGPCS